MNTSWNISARNTSKEHLQELFPLPSTLVPTRGTQLGIILRFRTFYLKIYDADKENAYLIQGFRYHEQTPVFRENVASFQIRKFASQFTQEDYLIRFQNLSDVPNCFE